MQDLSLVKTKDLLNELASRSGVEKIVGAGKISAYELKRKYSNNREEINPDVILVIESLDLLDSVQQDFHSDDRLWRRFELCFEKGPENQELHQLLDRLNLSRRELALIVRGLRVRPGFELRDFDT